MTSLASRGAIASSRAAPGRASRPRRAGLHPHETTDTHRRPAGRVRARVRARPLRASSDDDAPPPTPTADEQRASLVARANALRAKAIKVNLAALGVPSSQFFEKSELVAALVDAWSSRLAASVTVPLRQIIGMPGNPRAGYVVVTLDVGSAGFVDFLIDSGATAALISPALREMLGDSATDGAAIRGLGSMGETVRQKVTIHGASVGSKSLGDLDAVVTDLAAAGLPPVVGGLLGLDFLTKFQTEFDFGEKTLRFHPPGTIECGALDVSDLVEIPLATHPTGLKTVRCRLNGCEPFPAIVDMGSFLSVANWMAAAKAGVSPDSPEVNRSAMSAVGIDGRQMPMATAPFDLEVMGVEARGEGDGGGKESSLTSLYRGQCCVGDLPAFASLGAETSPFASMGLDVIGRGRTVFVPAEGKMWLTPGGAPGGGYPEAEGA